MQTSHVARRRTRSHCHPYEGPKNIRASLQGGFDGFAQAVDAPSFTVRSKLELAYQRIDRRTCLK